MTVRILEESVASIYGAPRNIRDYRASQPGTLQLTCDVFVYRALLPSYRPAPDYETAVQQKYRGAGQTSGNLNIRPNHQVGILYSSQPEIHQTHIQEVSC
jgi:hypothetical protein